MTTLEKNTRINRRSFLKGTSIGLMSIPLYGMTYTSTKNDKVRFNPKSPDSKKSEYHHVTCPRNCRDACALIAEVQDGVMIDIKGDKAHPVTQGKPCVKGNTYREYLYNPDRIMYPMKRVGKRTEGKWERLSWDEAYKLAADRLQDIIDEYGGEAVGEMVYSGNEGYISKWIAPVNFFEKIGATRLQRNPCWWQTKSALPNTIGTVFSKDALEIYESDMYVSWGSNEANTAVHWAKVAKAVKAKGGKLVVINSVRTPMANFADMFIQLKPSTDPFFCLGVCKVLIEENLYDKEFVSKYTIGFEDLVSQARSANLEDMARNCGIRVDQIITFAREYAKAQRPSIIHGDGGQRHFNGARLKRASVFLPALVGSLMKKGAGYFWAYVYLEPCYDFNKVMPDLSPKDKNGKKIKRQTANYVQFGRALKLDKPTSFDPDVDSYKEVELKTKIRAVINYNTNMMVTIPNTALIKKRLMEDDDLFLITLDPFHTDTVDYSDLVLPAGTFLESEDVQDDQMSGFISYNAAAAKLVGESKTNLEIFNGLARAMGFKDECFSKEWDSSEFILRRLFDTEFNKSQNITYERLVKNGWIKPERTEDNMKEHYPYFPYSDKFNTKSGKVELYSQHFKDEGFHPVIDLGTDEDYYRENKKFGPKYLEKYPLYFMTPGTQLQNNSNWGNVAYITERVIYDGYPEIFMHETDASARGLKEGSVVSATNELGEAFFRVRITSQVNSGVTYAWNNLWLKTTKTETGANFLCSDGIGDLGGGSVYTATYIEVKKVEE